MILRDILMDYEFEARLVTDHPASSCGRAVLVDVGTGEVIDIFTMAISKIIEATPEERQALADAGYISYVFW